MSNRVLVIGKLLVFTLPRPDGATSLGKNALLKWFKYRWRNWL